MSGVGSSPAVTERPPPRDPDAPLLEVLGLSALGDRGNRALCAADITVRSGEIVGVAGVAGNGQRELAEVIVGLRSATAGSVVIDGTDLTGATPRQRFRAGLGYVPEDRLGVGLAPRLSVVDNAVLRVYSDYRRGPLLAGDRAKAYCQDLVERFAVRTGALNDHVAGLSGGNLQRLLVGRELDNHPRVVVAAQPTRGLDVQGVKAIQDLLVAERDAGSAVLMISEDLAELLMLADRVLVMQGGRISGEFAPVMSSRRDIGVAMVGHRSDTEGRL